MSTIADNLQRIRERISLCAQQVGRDPCGINLIAVTKTRSASEVIELITAGQRNFGENRVQEAVQKYQPLKKLFPDIKLHMIGSLQTNKVKNALTIFDFIDSLDRTALAQDIAKAKKRGASIPRLRIEVNLGNEPQKGGVSIQDLPSLLHLCRDVLGIEIEGLMAIPPHGESPIPHFRKLRHLADTNGLSVISMGMSDDFEDAIREGSTEVRLGRILFSQL